MMENSLSLEEMDETDRKKISFGSLALGLENLDEDQLKDLIKVVAEDNRLKCQLYSLVK